MSNSYDDDATIVHFTEEAPRGTVEHPFTAVAVAPGRAAPNNFQYIAQQSSLEEYSDGVNPLVNSAAFLIMELIRLRKGQIEDLEALRDRLEAEIRGFTAQSQAAGMSEGLSTAARYLLCTALDESVTSSRIPGAQAEWSQRSLLSTFHNETWGGERFFQVLERTMQQPAANLYLLELLYILLSLGFEGKYRLEDRGPLALESMRDSLYRQIRLLRGEPSPDLSKKIIVDGTKSKIHTYVPTWVIASVVAICLTVTFVGFSYVLNMKSSPLLSELADLAPKGDPYVRPVSSEEEAPPEGEQGEEPEIPAGEAPVEGAASGADKTPPAPVVVGTERTEAQ